MPDITTREDIEAYRASLAEQRRQRDLEQAATRQLGASNPLERDANGNIIPDGPPAPKRPRTRNVVGTDGYVKEIDANEPAPLTNRERLLSNLQKITPQEIKHMHPQDKAAVQKLRSQHIDAIAEAFVSQNPEYYQVERNADALVSYLSQKFLHRPTGEDDFDTHQRLLYERGQWTVENLTEAYNELLRRGRLKVKPGTARELNAAEQRTVSRLCAAVRTAEDANAAITEYLRFALNQPTLDDWQDYTANPDYDAVLEQALWFVWEQSRSDYRPTETRREYLHSYLAGRFPTFDLFDAAWRACQIEEQRGFETIESTPTKANLERLHSENPEEFQQLFDETMKLRAKRVREAQGY